MCARVHTCVWGVCTVHERKAGVDGLLTAQKENFSETESAFPSIKILLIHLGGLIIMSESGFISRTSCHLSDKTVTFLSDGLAQDKRAWDSPRNNLKMLISKSAVNIHTQVGERQEGRSERENRSHT